MLQRLRPDSRHVMKILGGVIVGLMALVLAWTPVRAQGKGGTLRIGMTAADIANTAGIPDQGFEGYRFVGYQLYDALVRWDLSQYPASAPPATGPSAPGRRTVDTRQSDNPQSPDQVSQRYRQCLPRSCQYAGYHLSPAPALGP